MKHLRPNLHAPSLIALSVLCSALLAGCGEPPAPAPSKSGGDKPAESGTPPAAETGGSEPVAKTTAEEPTTAVPANDTAPAPDVVADAGTGGPTPAEATGGPAPEGTPVDPPPVDPKDGGSTKTATKKPAGDKTAEDGGDASASASDGAAPYGKQCKGCHGADGKGDTKFGKENEIPSLHATKLTKAKIVAILKAGVPDSKMKSYEGKLTDTEMAAVAAYVKTL